ncbi:MAG: sulfatase-like hydrolase/transferase [Verrucomicrobiota bacterium]
MSHGFDEVAAWKSQTIAHTYYPSTWVVDGEELPLEPGTYVHDEIMAKAFDFVKRHGEVGTPFFCYIPTAVPHAAMHAPPELHEKWRQQFPEFDSKVGKYGAGGEPCPDVINPIAGFAAMMENLDNQIGALLSLIETLGLDNETLIMFASDNGAHREGGHNPDFWNSSGGLRGMKRDMHEGGIRTPMLARWPGKIEAGSESDHLSGFQDILATVAALTHQPAPEQNTGLSFLPTLLGDSAKQEKHDFLYWEFCKGAEQKIHSQAVRAGDWKAFRIAGKPMSLYNLESDPFETTDVSAQHPDIVAKMEQRMAEARVPIVDSE